MGQRLIIKVFEDRNSVKDYMKGAICSIYYHWSAYSMSALDEADKFISAIMDELDDGQPPRQVILDKAQGFKNDLNMRVNLPNYNVVNFLEQKGNNIKLDDNDKESLISFLIRAVEKIGIRVDQDDYENMAKDYPNINFSKENLNRSIGLIAFSEEAQKKQMDWCEGLVTIYLREQEVDCDVYFFAEDIDYIKEEMRDMDEASEEEIDEVINNIKELKNDPTEMTYDSIGSVIEELEHLDECVWFKCGDLYIHLVG